MARLLGLIPAFAALFAGLAWTPAAAQVDVHAAAPAVPRLVMPREPLREYRIGDEDLLEISVFGVEQLKTTARVNPRGQVTLYLIGPITVAGLTAQEAEAAIAARLADKYMQDPQVTVFIKEFTTQRVTVEGAVNRPGVYPLKGQTTLLTSLALAGGPARMSETSQVMLFRDDGTGKRVATPYDVDMIRKGQLEDPPVYNDDLIVVNRTAGRVLLRDSVFGDVLEVINPFRYLPVP